MAGRREKPQYKVQGKLGSLIARFQYHSTNEQERLKLHLTGQMQIMKLSEITNIFIKSRRRLEQPTL
ncbi:Hypothetical predicted protein [Podarcis lilfordi]|uniref:Uncharacterized protein n=1 Tax=Podarcis lilfordi TaxID=74358 RepID=A0AA35PF85_9SAUR|nr:Hypothetical predicted protein [Podarcis lilfordi]